MIKKMEYFKNHFSNWEWRFDGKWPDTSYYGPVYTTTTTAIETFSNLGFTDIDFTSIKLLNDESINLKWNKDTQNSFYCNFKITSAGAGSHFYPIYSNGNTGTNFLSFSTRGQGIDRYGNVPDPCFIFLPLINNGFFVNLKSSNNSQTTLGAPEPQFTNIDTLFNFRNGDYAISDRYPEDGYDGFDLICIPSNKNKDLFYYLYGSAGTSFFNFLNWSYYPAIYMDLGNKKVKTLENFINDAIYVHGNKYDYSKVEYFNSNTKVCIICPKHGEFWQLPSKHLMGHGCQLCHTSKLENTVSEFLIAKGIKFEQQKVFGWLKSKQNFLRLDFYIPKYNVAIECQGIQHYKPVDFNGKGGDYSNKIFELTKQWDELKRTKCLNNKIRLLYFSDEEIKKEVKNENLITNLNILLENIIS